MIKRIHIIGIGMGNPDQLTSQAVRAMRDTDVFLVADKGSAKADLVRARTALCEAVIDPTRPYRVVEVTDPQRGPDRERDGAAYGQGVRDWHAARVDAYAEAITGLGSHEETLGFLVWGDPAFYDSTIRVVDALRERFDVTVDVIPGVSAPQLLAARHAIPLNRIGAPIHITTGRRLVDEYHPGLGDVVVMLDGHLECEHLLPRYPDLQIHWGADLGGPDEVLVAGRLADVIAEIHRARDALRAKRGWVMDTYLLSPSPTAGTPDQQTGWPAVTSLTDAVVTLRPMTEHDWPTVLAEETNAEARRWSFHAEPMAEPTARAAAAQAPIDWRSGRGARFVMVDAASDAPAGVISVQRFGPPDVGFVSYGVLPDFRGRGFTTRALRLLADWVFGQTSIVRLELGHKDGNDASGRAALNAGFVREGHFAHRLRNADGTFSDETSYGLVRPDRP